MEDRSVVREFYENSDMKRRLNQFFSRLPYFMGVMIMSEYEHFKTMFPGEEPYFIIKCHRKHKKPSRSDAPNWRPNEFKSVDKSMIKVIDEKGTHEEPVSGVKPLKLTIKRTKTEQVVKQKVIHNKMLNVTDVISEKIIQNREITREILREEITTEIPKIDGEIIIYRAADIVDEYKDEGCGTDQSLVDSSTETDFTEVKGRPVGNIEPKLYELRDDFQENNGTNPEAIEFIIRSLHTEYGNNFNLVNIIVKSINDNRLKVAMNKLFIYSLTVMGEMKKYPKGTPFLSKLCDLILHHEANIKCLTSNKINPL
jgi:hypothetical protein